RRALARLDVQEVDDAVHAVVQANGEASAKIVDGNHAENLLAESRGLRRQADQFLGGFRENAAAILLHHHQILDADAAAAGQIHAGLDAAHHAGLQHHPSPRAEARDLLVHVQPDAVTQAVAEKVAVARFGDDVSG